VYKYNFFYKGYVSNHEIDCLRKVHVISHLIYPTCRHLRTVTWVRCVCALKTSLWACKCL